MLLDHDDQPSILACMQYSRPNRKHFISELGRIVQRDKRWIAVAQHRWLLASRVLPVMRRATHAAQRLSNAYLVKHFISELGRIVQRDKRWIAVAQHRWLFA